MELFDKYMYRQSLINIEEIEKIKKEKGSSYYEHLIKLIEYIKEKDLELEIYLASEKLYNSMINIKETDSQKKIRNITISLYKYLLRMIFRTTPFGAFSGIGISNLKNSYKIEKDFQSNKLYFNISNELLYYLITSLYEDFETIKNIYVKINKNIYLDKTHIFIPFQVTYKHKGDTKDNNNISLKKNELLVDVIDICQEKIILNDLMIKLKKDYQVDESIIKNFLLNLIREDYLTTDLDINHSSNIDLSENILVQLQEKSDTSNIYITFLERLIEYRKNINSISYNNKHKKLELLIEAVRYVKNYFPSFKGDIFKVDLKHNNVIQEIDSEDINNIKEIFELFSKISLFNNKKILEDYKYKFSELYGQDECIPLLELLNPNLGLGIPNEYIEPASFDPNSIDDNLKKIHEIINEWRMDAIINQKGVEIDKKRIELLKEYYSTKIATSFDLYFNKILNKNNDSKYYLNPNTGSIEACQTYGRFTYMFDKKITNNIRDFRLQDNSHYEYVEVTYNHPQGKVQNIMNTFEDGKLNLVGESIYNISDLYVYLGDDFNFYLVSNSNNKILIPRFSNMHNTDISPIIIRFFNDIRNQFNTGWSSIRSYQNEQLYNPAVFYKNIVISPKTWIYKSMSQSSEKFETFCSEFSDYSKKMKIPEKFYLLENDGRVYIDISDELALQILYKEYMKNKKIEIISIEDELLNTPDSSIIEYVFSGKIKNVELINKQKTPSLVNHQKKDIIQVGNKWYSFNLYYNYYNLEKLLGKLNYKYFNTFDDNIEILYFIRYEDPESHIRLRIKTNSNFEKIISSLNNLIEENLVKESKLVPYRRESYRYGGVENIELAEKCFEIDSLIVSHYYENLITKDEEHKVMFGIDNIVNILDIFGYNSNNYEDVLKYVVLKVENKNYYRKNKGRLIDSIKNNEKYMELYDIRNYRENLYSEYVKKLKSYQEVDIHKVSMSIIHMFCNRLFGTDRNTESFLLEMLSRSYKDYKNIIKFRENHNG